MRRVITALLLVMLSIMLPVSCSKSDGGNEMPDSSTHNDQDMETIFQTICSAADALKLSKKTDMVVFERQGCTSGHDVWEDFYRKTMRESAATVLCAHYYALDSGEYMSKELYEEEEDQYPKLFFYLLEYDGKKYSVKVRESSVEALDYQETFKYLLHFTGEAPSTALYSSYDNYVLADDPTATWEGIMAGLVSSQFDAGYKHCTVYRNYLGWKGD